MKLKSKSDMKQVFGISRRFDKEKINLEYEVNTDGAGTTETPKEFFGYMKATIDTIRKDAKEEGGLENISISASGKYSKQLHQILHQVANEASEHNSRSRNIDSWATPAQVLVYGLAVGGGISGGILGYNSMSYFATKVTQYLNNTSHLWAPISGFVQLGGSLLGGIGGGVIGAGVGAAAALLLLIPYQSKAFPLSNKNKDYQKMVVGLKEFNNNSSQN